MRRLLLLGTVLITIAGLTGLGIWQVKRLMWKTALIETVNARTTAPAVALDAGRNGWPALNKANDEYRRVRLSGHFLNDKEVQVYALTEAGAGYWVLTPLVTDTGATIMVNRGYVPTDLKAPATRPAGQVSGPVAVTGLVRMSEVKGWLFSQPNDPPFRWYRRDTKMIATSQALGYVPPYFIDADATPVPGGWPKGGMTVIRFTNHHLSYALTWFAMAAGLAGVTFWQWRRSKEKERADDYRGAP
ncbi:MAG: SURF1 family protein [Asticcacaulis sp.]